MGMYTVHKLELRRDLFYSPKINGSETLARFINTVTRKNLNPQQTEYVTERTTCGALVDNSRADLLADAETVKLAAGTYLFVQGLAEGNEKTAEAMEALWLESVWRDITLDSVVYERRLTEDSKTVFQLFCPIRTPEACRTE